MRGWIGSRFSRGGEGGGIEWREREGVKAMCKSEGNQTDNVHGEYTG